MGVLFLFQSSPVYSQSTAALSPAAIAEINGVRTAVGVVAGPPPYATFLTGGAVAVPLTVAALGYLTTQSMQNLRDQAMASGVTHYAAGSQIVYASSLTGPGYSCRLECFVVNGGGSV